MIMQLVQIRCKLDKNIDSNPWTRGSKGEKGQHTIFQTQLGDLCATEKIRLL